MNTDSIATSLWIRSADKVMTILVSRKCWAFVATTWLTYEGIISEMIYGGIALAFMGIHGYLDAKTGILSTVNSISEETS